MSGISIFLSPLTGSLPRWLTDNPSNDLLALWLAANDKLPDERSLGLLGVDPSCRLVGCYFSFLFHLPPMRHVSRTGSTFFFVASFALNASVKPFVSACVHTSSGFLPAIQSSAFSLLFVCSVNLIVPWWCRFVDPPPHFLPCARAIVGPFRQPHWLWRKHYWRKWHGTNFHRFVVTGQTKDTPIKNFSKNNMDKINTPESLWGNWSWRLCFLLPVKPRILARK